MDAVFAAAANAFMQGSFSCSPHPALAYEQTRVYVSSIRCRLLGPGCVKRRRIESVLGPAVGEMSREAAARGSGSPAEESNADAG
jgi:hypothetical protein